MAPYLRGNILAFRAHGEQLHQIDVVGRSPLMKRGVCVCVGGGGGGVRGDNNSIVGE